MNIEYPKKIVLKEGEKLDLLRQHSQLIENLYDNQGNKGPLELTADLLFPRVFPQNTQARQQEQWEIFFDLFFPERGVGKLFQMRGNNVYVNERRGGKEAVREILDYLMVNSPNTMFNFARAQAKQQINASSEFLTTAPREKGKYHFTPMTEEDWRRIHNINDTDEYNNYNNYSNTNNSNISIGYKNEAEARAFAKLKGPNWKKYGPNWKKYRKTRRANRKMRKATRKNRK